MKNAAYDHGYGSKWKDVSVYRREGYYTSVSDFHEHDFYEINLILSGNFKILLTDQAKEAATCHLVLTKPGISHYISCKPDTLYSRLYLSFSGEFIDYCVPEWPQIASVFGSKGRILAISEEQKQLCKQLIGQVESETSPFRKKLQILYLLSCIGEWAGEGDKIADSAPSYLIEALNYIDKHYNEKITAADLAGKVYIGRTTLMNAFRKYTGSTFNSYLNHSRLKKALAMLEQGFTQQEAAENCGFGDSSGLNRCFKRYFGTTPGQYLARTL